MKVVLKKIYSYDVIEKLSEYIPDNPSYFCLDVILEIGLQNSESSDLFYLTICSIDWFSQQVNEQSSYFTQYHLVVKDFDFEKIENEIKSKLIRISGKDWNELANKISRFARWEYEDYMP